MMNKIARQRITSNETFVLLLLAIIFTDINVVYSTQFGRHAIPPTYDDIGYISNGFVLIDTGYQYGWGRWFWNN